MTLTIIWYALSGHHPDVVAEHRARAPWYLSKTNPSTADMLAKLRRVIIADQYRPRQDHTPTPAEITQVQQACRPLRSDPQIPPRGWRNPAAARVQETVTRRARLLPVPWSASALATVR